MWCILLEILCFGGRTKFSNFRKWGRNLKQRGNLACERERVGKELTNCQEYIPLVTLALVLQDRGGEPKAQIVLHLEREGLHGQRV